MIFFLCGLGLGMFIGFCAGFILGLIVTEVR
jgi:hypothetical protein